MKNCKFCNIENDRIVIESELSIAFYDLYPVNIGHSLIVPKRHISNYFELTSEEKIDIWNIVDKVKLLLEKEFKPDGFNVGINIGESAGQTIFHCHIHVIPRYQGDMDYPEGGVRGVIPSKQKYRNA
jgi:diadenosine tetraphosphate (Ap4A) HIT family hydrolase